MQSLGFFTDWLTVAGGGIIDLLNKRLRDRLKEVEILNIFTDICEVRAVPSSSEIVKSKLTCSSGCGSNAFPPSATTPSRSQGTLQVFLEPLVMPDSWGRSRMYSPNRHLLNLLLHEAHHLFTNFATLVRRPSPQHIHQHRRPKQTRWHLISTSIPPFNIGVQKWWSRCLDGQWVYPVVSIPMIK